jgi:hypothetical protein
MMYRVSRHFASAVVIGLCIIPAIAVAESGDSRSEWPMFGQNEQKKNFDVECLQARPEVGGHHRR